MFRYLSRFFVVALIVASGVAMTVTPFDADAARVGGGTSSGRQSSNVTNKSAPATTSTATPAKPAAAPAAAAPAAAAKPAGASRWLGPLAGIAAGLGIAALLSHFGMSGAVADFLVMGLLAALVVFAIMFVVRMLRGGSARPAYQGAGSAAGQQNSGMMRESSAPSYPAAQPAAPVAEAASTFGANATQQPDSNWFIPGDFDTQRFLQEAKQQFVAIQKVWDSGDIAQLRNFLTDDLTKEMQAQLVGRTGENFTEVVLLNAELLGIEKVSDGHLASVRFSGMLREQVGAEAFRFEEVWNLFKPEQGGWLLAGIQQIPVEHAS